MLVTLSGIIVFEQPVTNLLDAVSIIALQLLRESYVLLFSSTVIEFKLLQQEKADSPILVTLSGMVMEVRLLQYQKA